MADPMTQHSGLLRLRQLAAAQACDLACDRFYFLRHGQTPRNAIRIFQAPDEPLSELGIAQAEAAAAVLAAEPVAAIVCSDAHRAHQTARIVAAHHPLHPVLHEDLRERNFGALIGTSSAGLDWNCVPENGETLETFVERATRGLKLALQNHPQPTLVVAHGGTLQVLAGWLGIDATPAMMANAHPLRFDRMADGRWSVTPLARASDAESSIS